MKRLLARAGLVVATVATLLASTVGAKPAEANHNSRDNYDYQATVPQGNDWYQGNYSNGRFQNGVWIPANNESSQPRTQPTYQMAGWSRQQGATWRQERRWQYQERSNHWNQNHHYHHQQGGSSLNTVYVNGDLVGKVPVGADVCAWVRSQYGQCNYERWDQSKNAHFVNTGSGYSTHPRNRGGVRIYIPEVQIKI